MFLGRVVGTVWATKKSPDLEGVRFLVVHPIELDKEPTRSIVVVADRLGAAVGDQEMAIEAAVVAIVDRVDVPADTPSDELRAAAHERRPRDNGRR